MPCKGRRTIDIHKSKKKGGKDMRVLCDSPLSVVVRRRRSRYHTATEKKKRKGCLKAFGNKIINKVKMHAMGEKNSI